MAFGYNSFMNQTLSLLRKNLSDNFCLVPFTNIILEPDGKVGLCRNKGDNFPIGNIKDKSLDEIWDIRNNPKALQWRQEFLDNKPVICENEVKYRKCHLEYGFNTLASDAELTAKQTGKILRLTANLNGHCNLRCPFCTVWQSPNGNYTEENFWIPARLSLFPYLKEIDMLGGEPFVQADTFKLIKEVSALNPHCQWFFTTNMAWSINNKVASLLDLIEIKILTISLDSLTPSVYERLRPPAKLHNILKNLDQLKSYNKGRAKPFKIAINALFQKENWQELPEIIRFCIKNDFALNPILLRTPEQSSLLNYSQDKINEILNFYFMSLEAKDLKLITPIIISLIETLPAIDRAHFYQKLRSTI